MKVCVEEKGASRLAQVRAHAENMDVLASHFRDELRDLIHRYRICRTSRQVCDIREIYLEAEDIVLRRHIQQVYALYREAFRDLHAIRRVEKTARGGQKVCVCEGERREEATS